MEKYIHISIVKAHYLKHLVRQYTKLGFKDYDLFELAKLSLSEWKYKRYPIPKGYRVKPNRKSNNFEKISKDELIRQRIRGKKRSKI